MPPAGYRSTTEVEIKKSRFITTVGRTDTETEARDLIAEVRGTYPDARHHCQAFRLDEDGVLSTRTSDDGEPAGTGGAPMLNSLTHADVVNITAVVTRYFGGIKLGASGLARAYGGCVADAVAAMPRVVRRRFQVWSVRLPHADAGRVQDELLRCGAVVLEVEYDPDGVCIRFHGDDGLAVVARATQGECVPIPDGVHEIETPC
ncbi:MAG: YigZ family protein [Propionibacteriaceae bacterium]|nr:YigZ family protein [Propionibacteriaceae bacterium]